jgi:cytochrome P450
MEEVAAPVAEFATCQTFGISSPGSTAFTDIAHAIALRMDSGLVPEQADGGVIAGSRLTQMVERWRATSDKGLINTITCDTEFEWTEPLLNRSLAAMINAAYSTIYASIGNVSLLFISRPELYEAFAPSNLISGIDELIRFDSPAQATSRVATRRVELGLRTIERGQDVITMLGAANRDPEHFSDPDDLIVDRNPNPHMGFGWGAHACLGAELARMCLKSYVAALLDRNPIRSGGQYSRRPTATLRWLKTLPVSLD